MITEYEVFNHDVLQDLLKSHYDTLKKMSKIEEDLKNRFLNMEDAIQALILSVISGENLLLVGPPGTAKSRLIREFCRYVGIKPENDSEDYFDYLLTPFTEPSELFGYFELVPKDGVQKLKRNTDNMMQKARVVFLDEVFNASSAILNSLLTFMNERKFYDRATSEDVKMQCLFGATNFTPQRDRRMELSAIFDRFLLRAFVGNVSVDSAHNRNDLSDLMDRGWMETYGRLDSRDQKNHTEKNDSQTAVVSSTLLEDLRNLQIDIKLKTQLAQNGGGPALQPDKASEFFNILRGKVLLLRQYEYSAMSNRRLIKLLHVMLMQVLYEASKGNMDTPDFRMGQKQMSLLRFAVDHWDDHLFQLLDSGAKYAE